MYVWQRWLADEFRAAGLEVIEVEGWENRGRPASTGHFNPQGPVTDHHTGVHSSASDPGPTLRTLIVGRSDLPGPLCQWSVRHDGKVVVIAAGRANHAGKVGKSGVRGMPLGADGNALALGDEVDTDGRQKMPPAQRHAVDVTNAIALRHYDAPVAMLHRHADISGSGKWDLGGVTTEDLRRTAANVDQEDDMTEADRKLLERIAKGIEEGNRLGRLNLRRGNVVTRLLLRIEGETDESLDDLKAAVAELDAEDAKVQS